MKTKIERIKELVEIWLKSGRAPAFAGAILAICDEQEPPSKRQCLACGKEMPPKVASNFCEECMVETVRKVAFLAHSLGPISAEKKLPTRSARDVAIEAAFEEMNNHLCRDEFSNRFLVCGGDYLKLEEALAMPRDDPLDRSARDVAIEDAANRVVESHHQEQWRSNAPWNTIKVLEEALGTPEQKA